MTLTKNSMVREIGRRTRLKNREVKLMLETLIELWTQELSKGERIELEKFMVFETKVIERRGKQGTLAHKGLNAPVPRSYIRLSVRASKYLRKRLRLVKM